MIASKVIDLLTDCLKDDLETLGEKLNAMEVDNELLESAIHFMYHYLADEDLRSRDQEYKYQQRNELREYIARINELEYKNKI